LYFERVKNIVTDTGERIRGILLPDTINHDEKRPGKRQVLTEAGRPPDASSETS
jgi:hypothetical protein